MSEIQRYFENKTVFITGSSGFLGKLLLEKLLRACFRLNKIYVLLREKKDLKPKERLEEIFNLKAFDSLKTNRGNFLDKISILNGNLEGSNLGLSEEDLEMFKENVEIVFHCGATVRFDETLKRVAIINVKATKDLINICKQTKKLESFVYVSTAYSNCNLKVVKEEIYEPYLKEDIFMNIINGLDDDILNKITPIILKDLPNTYVLSKAAAENLLLDEGKGLPISIVRPSIVIPSISEPMPGWTDNYFGLSGFFAVAGVGLLHCHCGDPAKKLDSIPVDYVVNNLIAVAFDTFKRKNEPETNENTLKIFNSTCGTRNPISWGDFTEKVSSYKTKYPFMSSMWYPFGRMIKSKPIYFVNLLLLQYFPALIVDFILILILKEPFMFKLANKLAKFVDTLSYFPSNEWTFDDSNNKALYENLSKEDRTLFNFDVESINWDEYAEDFVKGLRIYLMKDPLETLPAAKRKLKVLTFIHYFTIILLICLIIKFIF